MDFYALENQDAIRHSWNCFPSSKQQLTKSVIPISALYSPNKDLENLALVEYAPIKCKCQAVLNPYCQVDLKSKVWVCPFCQTRNQFPSNYAQYITEQNLPPELVQQYSTIEYIDTQQQVQSNIYLFVIDTCVPQEELNCIKESIQQSLNMIPSDSLVGLVTFGKFVFVHELGFQDCPKSYAFNGQKEYTTQQLAEQLGIYQRVNNQNQNMIYSKFLVSLQDCEFQLNSILDDLQADSWFTPSGMRQLRATGSALNIACSLLECSPIQGARVFTFIGGVCTYGPGIIVNPTLDDNIRTFNDITKNNNLAQHFKKSTMFYQNITNKCISSQMTINIFAFTLDQFGLTEMKSLTENTGGYIVMNEMFDSESFRDSYKKLFEKDQNGDQKTGCQAKLTVLVSNELRICGMIGQGTSLKKKNDLYVSDTQVGKGGTNQWYLGQVDKCSTVCMFYDINNQINKVQAGRVGYFQYQTIYKHSTGRMHLRITTIARKFCEENNYGELAQSFDQEATCTVMSRLSVLKTETEEHAEVLKWVDRNLIRLVSRFSNYKQDAPKTFELFPNFLQYPQFMYHFRRSHFIQAFGISPDESTFYKQTLLRENTTNSLVMIQPALLQYTLQNPNPEPIHLDIEALKPDVILLLDTYFQVIIWHGSHIHQWKQAGHQFKPEFAHFKEQLEAPIEDSKLILEDRFPAPIHFVCEQGSGKERYLKSKVNPSGANAQNAENSNYITDDASLKVFMDYLIKLVVQTPK